MSGDSSAGTVRHKARRPDRAERASLGTDGGVGMKEGREASLRDLSGEWGWGLPGRSEFSEASLWLRRRMGLSVMWGSQESVEEMAPGAGARTCRPRCWCGSAWPSSGCTLAAVRNQPGLCQACGEWLSGGGARSCSGNFLGLHVCRETLVPSGFSP